MDRGSTFAALRSPGFRLLFFGLTASSIGGQMQLFALGWLAVLIAGREGQPQAAPLYLGLLGLARAVPALGAGLVAGAVADRMDRRTLLLLTQGGSMALSLALSWLVQDERIGILPLLVLYALVNVAQAFDVPARTAMIPRLVPPAATLSAFSLHSLTYNGTSLVGPLIGGVLIVPFGIPGIVLVAALAYVPVLAAILGLPSARAEAPTAGVLGSILEGFRFVWDEPQVRWSMGLLLVLALMVRPYQFLMPAVVHEVYGLGATELSWMLSAAGGGSVLAAFVSASLGGIRRQGLLCIGLALAAALVDLAWGVQRGVPAALPLIFVLAAAFSTYTNVMTAL